MYQELKNKNKIISVIGLGYVGLPLALEFGKYFKVIGFDISLERIEMMVTKSFRVHAVGKFGIGHALSDECLGRFGIIGTLLFLLFTVSANRLMVEG